MSEARQFTGWRKSTWSSGFDNCVEVAVASDGWVGVRDSKEGGLGAVLEFAAEEWNAFLGGVRSGEFDLR